MAFFRNGEFGVGVGSIILLINPILLGAYTFGCHSFRHLIGGKMDCFSCSHSRELASFMNQARNSPSTIYLLSIIDS